MIARMVDEQQSEEWRIHPMHPRLALDCNRGSEFGIDHLQHSLTEEVFDLWGCSIGTGGFYRPESSGCIEPYWNGGGILLYLSFK